MAIGIFFGSTTGNTDVAASLIADEFGGSQSAILDVSRMESSEFLKFDVIIAGVPTWNIGEMQDDWAGMIENLDSLDLSGKKFAIFGLGDARGYPDTFVDAMGELWEAFQARGVTLIGLWPTDDYEFEESKGLYDADHFLGLVLDEDNEADKSPERIHAWVEQLKQELGL